MFLYVIGGNGYTGAESETSLSNETIVLFEDGDQVMITTEGEPVRFLFLAGKPIREPVAWGGPIVMNTREEVQQAFREYEEGTFLK